MKRVFLLAVIAALCVHTSHAQTFRVIGGLGAGVSKGNLKGLNYVLNRYNETRQGQSGAAKVTSPMGNINWLHGINWQVGFTFQQSSPGPLLYLGLSRLGRVGSTYATVTDINGKEGRRDVKFSANTVNAEMGYGYGDETFIGMLGGSLDILSTRAYTKLNSDSYSKVMGDMNLGMSIFFDASVFVTERIAIGIRPYVQLALLETDYYDLNQAINPATYFNDGNATYSRFNNWGCQVMLRIATIDD